MASHYNQRARRVLASDISSVTLYNTTMTRNWDVEGSFVFEGYHTTAGCGTAQDSGFLILLKDTIPWTKMCFKWQGTGTASCWSFSDSTAHASATGTPTGNMHPYNEASGDRLHDNYLTWEQAAYQPHNRTTACDNQADNFFRFNSALLKRFRMTRRRSTTSSLSGIHHGRSCSSAGIGSISIISEIFIW